MMQDSSATNIEADEYKFLLECRYAALQFNYGKSQFDLVIIITSAQQQLPVRTTVRFVAVRC
jgi:hypothetical protein